MFELEEIYIVKDIKAPKLIDLDDMIKDDTFWP